MLLVTAEEMRRIDRVTIDERGVPAGHLMEQAGLAVAADVAEHFDLGTVVLLCGRGNNGGDGFVAARILAQAGWAVTVVHADDPAPASGPAREAWEKMPATISRRRFSEFDRERLTGFLSDFDVAVDALLGTGTAGPLRSPWREAVEALNAARIPVVSVDIPSGLNPDTGAAEPAVLAFRTVTIGLPKIGMVQGHGPSCCGTVRVAPIGFPRDLLEGAVTRFRTLTTAEARALLPPRPSDGHKGTFGTAVVVAGAEHMPGAAVLAGLGALRGGCGLVRLHVPDPVRPIVATHLPEALLTALPGGREELSPLGPDGCRQLLKDADALAVGPGVGEGPGAAALLGELLAADPLPTVLDASALNLIAADRALAGRLHEAVVLTPHPGEMARLLDCRTTEVQLFRWDSAAEAAHRFRCTVLLKGAGSLVATPDGRVTHVPTGNSAWARGGSGDVLTGLIASLMAQGCEPGDAAALGAFVHGMAADVYTRDRSPRGALTREVADCLPQAFRELERG